MSNNLDDVVSVIRCKDCTNAIFNKLDGCKYCVAGFEKTIASAYVAIGNPIFARRDDDFCSRGERRKKKEERSERDRLETYLSNLRI